MIAFEKLPCLLLCCTALLAACSTHYVPAAKSEVKLDKRHELSTTSAVSLVNAQPSKKEVKIGSMGNLANPKDRVYADFNAWTDVVVRLTSDTLKKNGVRVEPGGNKTLQLAVENAHVTHGTYMGMVPVSRPSCQVVLKVTTTDGYVQSYDVTGKTLYAGWKSSCDEAMTQIVEALLTDEKIVDYLKQ